MAKVKELSIPQMIQQLDQKVVKEYDIYIGHHKALMPYANRELSEEEVKLANGILAQIQDSFKELYAAFGYIQERQQFTLKAINEFVSFKNGLKGAGAEPVTAEIVTPETKVN